MIGSTLKKLLAERNMPVGELARRVEVPPTTLYSVIRRDNMKIDFDLLLRICDELGVPIDVFCGDRGVPAGPTAEELALLAKYRRLDDYDRQTASLLMDRELGRQAAAGPRPAEKQGRVIPLYLTPAAAGYASPVLDEDYEDYTVDADSPADFAVRIAGDSMEPVIADGSVVLVKREHIANGDVGMFFVDGDMKCKQYVRDPFGNVYLLSLNRDRADADVTVPASSGVTLCCFGKVLLEKQPPIPV